MKSILDRTNFILILNVICNSLSCKKNCKFFWNK